MDNYIDVNEIPAYTGYSLAQLLNDVITEYFEDPVHQQEFEKWQKEKEEIERIRGEKYVFEKKENV